MIRDQGIVPFHNINSSQDILVFLSIELYDARAFTTIVSLRGKANATRSESALSDMPVS